MAPKKQSNLSSGQAAFRRARLRGVPLVAIETSDPAATIQKSRDALNGKGENSPMIVWDCVRGARGLNDEGNRVLSLVVSDGSSQDPIGFLAALVEHAATVDPNGNRKDCDLVCVDPQDPDKKHGVIVFMIHFNRFLGDAFQAVWNCRDVFESEAVNGMLVMLGPSFSLPAEIRNDLIVISEPLPAAEELGGIVDKLADDCGLKEEQIGNRELVVDVMRGTSAFGARQSLAMSLTPDGVDTALLWERKRKLIEQTRGLKVWKGGETFDDLKGLDRIQGHMTRILRSGKSTVRLILFADEIEKQLAGVGGGDLSGTTDDAFGKLLEFLNDYDVALLVLIGPPGTGKSAIAKAFGNVAGAPVIAFDLGAMKDKYVGSSEQAIREALQVSLAISDGKLIMVMTCNAMAKIPPELKRRATLGIYFVDLPTAEAQADIWNVWIKKYGLDGRQARPDCAGWSGAEIKACCDIAYRGDYTLKEAAGEVVPIIQSDPERVYDLRKWANGRINSANFPGKYRFESGQSAAASTAPASRKVNLGE